jgi:hypothetical protein
LVSSLQAVSVPWCGRCLADRLGVALPQLYAVTARLLAQGLARTAAAQCASCRHPRLVIAAGASAVAKPTVPAGQADAALLS